MSPLLKQVYQSLRERIQSRDPDDDALLPSASSLCRHYGVSRPSLFIVLEKLEQDGLISRRSGSRAVIVASTFGTKTESSANETPVKFEKPKCRKIADALIEEIRNGSLRMGDILPSQKELRFRYRTSKPTMAKAMTAVAKKGLIFRDGSVFRVGSPNLQSLERGNPVVLFPGGFQLRAAVRTIPNAPFIRAMEGELNGRGLRMTKRLEWKQDLTTVIQSPKKDEAYGLVYMFGPAALRRIMKECRNHKHSSVPRLLNFDQPTVFYCLGTFYGPQERFAFRHPNNLYILAHDNALAGQEIGHYLATLGHSRVGFFHYSNEPWNRARLEGLRQGVESVLGTRGHVSVFTPNMNKATLIDTAAESSQQKEKAIQLAAAKLFKDYKLTHTKPFGSIYQDIFTAVLNDDQTRQMAPFLQDALDNHNLTAWVCADATASLIAEDYLHKRSIRIPDEISLIGMDDKDSLMARCITAHDFQTERMGYLAAHCLLQDIPIKRSRNGIVFCPGRIIDRGTVARAPKPS